ncbi:PAS domain-containing sensor histidine kinase [Ramlibacter sp. AW1]|uniref:histidine kinase n=1 Tax=Ramlibacter aurantiacus TaxID=2801330 RepID=A0A936ZN41_9BURK|nr:PAS domain-containing sensor histidine kinase [Ramlibacter aurantiacus]MBL0422792.1 PAS domain-containing sensor histidine kinase [Ramlibacter aurantiacus]
MAGPVSVAPWDALPHVPQDPAFARLWRGFATARVVVAAVLLLLLGMLMGGQQPLHPDSRWVLGICVLYLLATVAARLMPQPARRQVGPRWVFIIGVDLAVIAALDLLQAGGASYGPLLALPVLMASVLGSSRLALGTAAGVTLLLLAEASARTLVLSFEMTPTYLQAGLTGLGYFALALLAQHLAGRLEREEESARRSRDAARLQAHVNELVIETLAAGILVVDEHGLVRACNPTAAALLGHESGTAGFRLSERSGWLTLLELARRTIEGRAHLMAEVTIGTADEPQRPVMVRTRVAGDTAEAGADGDDGDGAQLCVIFLEDLRELEARLRTEKLAAMGRMSAAVAHEIRNPLTAIGQANALLDEELTDPTQRQLSALVQQNVQRLAQIVDDVLDVARVKHPLTPRAAALPLDLALAGICPDWARQSANADRLRTSLQAPGALCAFEPDHLRRVLVNLLDNAARYAGTQPDSIQVATSVSGDQLNVAVWSDGPPLESTVQQHLFEPFFSSESRSSGLGLYICRQLCERHGARIGYGRTPAPLGAPREGNNFLIHLNLVGTSPADGEPSAARIRA